MKKEKQKKSWNQNQKIMSALKKVWRWSPMRAEALKRAHHALKIKCCEKCKALVHEKLVDVHHVFPVREPGSGLDWNEVIPRLFCPTDELQVLCEPCHKLITQEQKEERKKYAVKKKPIKVSEFK